MKRFLRKKFIIPAVIVLVIGGFIVLKKAGQDDGPAQRQPAVAGVSTQIVSRKDAVEIPITLSGKIQGKQSTVIRALADGTVQSLVPVGTQVSVGTPLFQISNPSIEQAYQSALSSAANAQASFSQTTASSQSTKAQAQITLDQAEQNLELAKQAVIDAQTTGQLNLKKAEDTARITYGQAYNLLGEVMRYLGGSNLVEYRFKNLLNSNQSLYFKALDQFVAAKEIFLATPPVAGEGLKSSMQEIKMLFSKIDEFNDSTITLLEFSVTSGSFSASDLSLAKTQTASFRAQLNPMETLIAGADNALEDVATQNQITLDSLRKKVEVAELQVESAKTALSLQTNASEIQRLGSQSQLSAAQSQLAAARRAYQNLRVPSPFAGRVISHRVQAGSQITPGQEIIEVGNLEGIEVKLSVSASLGEGLRLGQKATVNGTETARVSEIEPAADLTTGKIGLTVEADNQNSEFLPGTIAEVKLTLEFPADSIITVPLKALRIKEGSKSVLLVRDGKASEQLVQTGELFGEQIEITQGLRDGDELIIDNSGFLQEGETVNVQN